MAKKQRRSNDDDDPLTHSLLEKLGEKLEVETAPEEPKDIRHNPDLDAVFGM